MFLNFDGASSSLCSLIQPRVYRFRRFTTPNAPKPRCRRLLAHPFAAAARVRRTTRFPRDQINSIDSQKTKRGYSPSAYCRQ